MKDHITARLMATTDKPDTQPETIVPATPRDESIRSAGGPGDRREHLAPSELLRRTAMDALSPDTEDLQKRLAAAKHEYADANGRQLNFPLVLVVVALVFTILVLDLLLTGL